MKLSTSIFPFLLVIVLSAPISLANHEGHPHDAPTEGVAESSKDSAATPGTEIRVKARGIVCDYCVRAMEKVILKRPEVHGLRIDLTSKLVVVTLKKGSQLDDDTVKKLVTESGYDIDAIERT